MEINMNPIDIITIIILWGIPLILAITLHEAGHALAAKKLGDPTADQQGRVTLNPIKHIDPFGTVLLPLMLFFMKAPFLFGYARPVPVDYNKLRTLPRDIALVAFAGPAANILLIILSAILYNFIYALPTAWQEPYSKMIVISVTINTVLALFNMLPIPPLDGSKILMALGPRPLGKVLYELERYGMFIILGLLLMMPLFSQLFGYNPLGVLFLTTIKWVVNFIEPLTKLHCFFIESNACGRVI